MFQAFIRFLISVLVIGLCVVLFVWVLGIVGIHLPVMAINILYAIAALVCLLFLFRLLSPYMGEWWKP